MNRHVFLDGSAIADSRLHIRTLGGWSCLEEFLPEILDSFEGSTEVTIRPRAELSPHKLQLFKTGMLGGPIHSTLEGWGVAISRIMIDLSSRFDDDILHFHILSSTLSHEQCASFRERFLQDIDDALDCSISPKQICFVSLTSDREILPVPEDTKDDLVQVASMLCLSISTGEYCLPKTWKVMEIDAKRLVLSESRILEMMLERKQDLAHVMFRLCQLGYVSEKKLGEVAQTMSASDWQDLCDLLKVRLVGKLAEGSQRYLELDDSYALAQTVPWELAGAMKDRVRFQILRGIQKVMAHRGEWSRQLVETLNVLISSPFVFTNELERFQAKIDVVLDDVQHRLVNAMNPDPKDESLKSVLERYEQFFGTEGTDQNRARLHGTIGQLLALRAFLQGPTAEARLDLAMEHFVKDERSCASEYDLRTAIGYQVACAFQMGDLVKLQTEHRRERQYYSGVMPGLTCVAWSPEQIQTSSFLVLHDLQRHASLVRSGRPVPDGLSDLMQAWEELDESRKVSYPVCLIGKWLSVLLLLADRHSDALHVAEECGASTFILQRLPKATQWIHLICGAIALELADSSAGLMYVRQNLELVQSIRPQAVESFLVKLDALDDCTPVDRVWGLATLLPFYFT